MPSPQKMSDNAFPQAISMPIRRAIYVIDDDSDVRKSLHFRFANSFINVWPFATAADFLENLAFLTPAPILLDVRMADIDGLQLLQMLVDRAVKWPVVIITAHGDVGVAVKAMKLGAIEFLEKPYDPDALDSAIDQAFALLDQSQNVDTARDEARHKIERLAKRERETIAILMEGVSNKEVAHRLGLSVRTVEMHRAKALAKLDVKSIAEVVRLATVGGIAHEK